MINQIQDPRFKALQGMGAAQFQSSFGGAMPPMANTPGSDIWNNINNPQANKPAVPTPTPAQAPAIAPAQAAADPLTASYDQQLKDNYAKNMALQTKIGPQKQSYLNLVGQNTMSAHPTIQVSDDEKSTIYSDNTPGQRVGFKAPSANTVEGQTYLRGAHGLAAMRPTQLTPQQMTMGPGMYHNIGRFNNSADELKYGLLNQGRTLENYNYTTPNNMYNVRPQYGNTPLNLGSSQYGDQQNANKVPGQNPLMTSSLSNASMGNVPGQMPNQLQQRLAGYGQTGQGIRR